MKAMATLECDDETLPVTCGNQTGVLHARLFLCPGIHQECIKVNDQLVTPKMFSVMGDKEKLKDWKNAIRIRGVSVRKMMDTGELNYYKHKELCSGKCVSRNMGGSKYDISRFERDHELPTFPPLIAAMEQQCTQRPRELDPVSQPVFPMAMAVTVTTDSNDATYTERAESKSNSPAPASSQSQSPPPPKLSGAAKRKSKTVKKEVISTRIESPLELNADSLTSSCASPISLQADDASQINDPYLHRALLGLADCNLNECFIKQEPQDFAEDLTAKSALVAKAIVSKTLSSLKPTNGHIPSMGSSINNNNPALSNNCGDAQLLSQNVDRLLSLDIREDSQVFWQGIMDLGLINDFFREIKNSLDVLKNDLIKGRAQREDSLRVSDIVSQLGLVTKLRWKLAGKKPDNETQKEMAVIEFPSIRRKMVDADQKRMDNEKKSECFSRLFEMGLSKGTNGLMRSYCDTNGGSSGGGSYCSETEDLYEEPQDLSCGRKRPRRSAHSTELESMDIGPGNGYNGFPRNTASNGVMISLKNGSFEGVGHFNGHLEPGEINGDERAKKRRKNAAHRSSVSHQGD